jgi:hypothetical protein
MAFSLEAALVVPLALGVWAGLLGLAAPAYIHEAQAAGQAVAALQYAHENQHVYQTRCLTGGDHTETALQVSPQVIVEWAGLVQDGVRLVENVIAGDEGVGSAQSEDVGS